MNDFRQVARIAVRVSAICWLGIFMAGPAFAHGVVVFAWVEGDTVHVESKFSGGRKVKGGTVVVQDLQGNRLLSGATDAQGKFDFTIPARTDLKIVLTAGMGHRGEWSIPAAEIEAGGHGSLAAQTPALPAAAPPTLKSQTPAPGPDLAAIETVVEKALDRKLKPVLQMLADSRHSGPTLKDILGGIGYILGLVGVAAYVHNRKRP